MRKQAVIQVARKRIGRRRRRISQSSTPILELVSAVYSINDAIVTLTFNRAINTDQTNPPAFWINDGLYSQEKLQGATYQANGSDSVIVWFDQVESFESSTCTMDVQTLNGIKDAITGDEWGGVTGFELTTG